MEQKLAREIMKQQFVKMAKELVAEKGLPEADIRLVEQMWDDIQSVSKTLRDINKRIEVYKMNAQDYFNERSRYKTYEDYKKVLKKSLSEVKEYCDYVSDKITKVSNKL